MVYTWALQGLLCHDFGAHVGTKMLLGPLGQGEGAHPKIGTAYSLSLEVQVPKYEVSPKTMITVPSTETLHTLYYGTVDPQESAS